MKSTTCIRMGSGILLLAGSSIFLATVGTRQQVTAQTYSEQIGSRYNYRFSKNKSFAPGNAKTVTGDFIQPGAFPTAGYCAHCHQEAYHQWRQSLHSNSFRTPFYLTSVDILIRTKGIEYSRHCDSCHNPIAVLSGALTPGSKINRKFDDDGVTCTVCHSIQALQSTSGNGSYIMGVPAVMVDAKGNRIPGEVPDDEILKHPERHAQAVMKDFYKTPEFCAACHKANLPAALNDYKFIRDFDTYDEWQMSPFSKRSPLTFYPAKPATCQSCHMPREHATLSDYGAKNGIFASHRWLAGNTAVPFFYKYDEQLEKTIKFLQFGDYLNVDIFGIKKVGNDRLIAPLGSVPFQIEPKDVLETFVVVQNKGIGHSLLPEIRDLYQAWVEFIVQDATGKAIYHSGFIKPDGMLDERAHAFVKRPIDQTGNFVDNHEVWRIHSVGYDNTIQAGGSQLVRYQFRIPANVAGPITITARVNYRHFRQSYLNTVLGENHPAYPVVQIASRSRTLNIGQNLPEPANPADNPDWMRWNNLGISYLEEFSGTGFAPSGSELYSDMIDAFQETLKLRPDYADGYINLGLTNIEWKKFDAARSDIQKALLLAPNNARALYYDALIEKQMAHPKQAIADLRSVVEQYPQSRDARRELGALYLAEQDNNDALEQIRALQQIDPDDLSAHFNLSILYGRLGMREQAAEQQRLFETEKPDPAAPTYSLNYLRAHPEMLTEGVPGHIHTDTPHVENR